MLIICRLHYPYIRWHTPHYLFIIESLFPQCRFSRPTAKVTGLWVVTLSDTGEGQELVYCPEVQELARRIGLTLNGCWNFWWIFWFSWWYKHFMGDVHSIVTLSSNDQNSSFVHTCLILVAPSCPSNVPNFTTAPPPTSSNQLNKY